jgi:hypothetical protein
MRLEWLWRVVLGLALFVPLSATAADLEQSLISTLPQNPIEVKRWVCHPTGEMGPWVVVLRSCKKDCPPEQMSAGGCSCIQGSAQRIAGQCGWAYGYLGLQVCANVLEHGRLRHHWWWLTFDKDAVIWNPRTEEGPEQVRGQALLGPRRVDSDDQYSPRVARKKGHTRDYNSITHSRGGGRRYGTKYYRLP